MHNSQTSFWSKDWVGFDFHLWACSKHQLAKLWTHLSRKRHCERRKWVVSRYHCWRLLWTDSLNYVWIQFWIMFLCCRKQFKKYIYIFFYQSIKQGHSLISPLSFPMLSHLSHPAVFTVWTYLFTVYWWKHNKNVSCLSSLSGSLVKKRLTECFDLLGPGNGNGVYLMVLSFQIM